MENVMITFNLQNELKVLWQVATLPYIQKYINSYFPAGHWRSHIYFPVHNMHIYLLFSVPMCIVT